MLGSQLMPLHQLKSYDQRVLLVCSESEKNCEDLLRFSDLAVFQLLPVASFVSASCTEECEGCDTHARTVNGVDRLAL